jgi:hypothetical protein
MVSGAATYSEYGVFSSQSAAWIYTDNLSYSAPPGKRYIRRFPDIPHCICRNSSLIQ